MILRSAKIKTVHIKQGDNDVIIVLGYYRLGQLSQEVDFCRQIRGKVGKHTFLDENYALKTKILFTKLGSAILTFN